MEGTNHLQNILGGLGEVSRLLGLEGLALALPMPLLLRGKAYVDNYFPNRLPAPSPNIMRKISETYPVDSKLRSTIERVMMRPYLNAIWYWFS